MNSVLSYGGTPFVSDHNASDPNQQEPQHPIRKEEVIWEPRLLVQYLCPVCLKDITATSHNGDHCIHCLWVSPRYESPRSKSVDPVLKWRMYGGCYYCGILPPPEERHLDHFHPKSKGGEGDWHNLVPACRSCNCRKKDKTVNEYREYLGEGVIFFAESL